MQQVRVSLEELVPLLNGLIGEKLTWPDVTAKYPLLATAKED